MDITSNMIGFATHLHYAKSKRLARHEVFLNLNPQFEKDCWTRRRFVEIYTQSANFSKVSWEELEQLSQISKHEMFRIGYNEHYSFEIHNMLVDRHNDRVNKRMLRKAA